MSKTSRILFALVLIHAAAGCTSQPTRPRVPTRYEGLRFLDQIQSSFAISGDSPLLAEQIMPTARRPAQRTPASCWPAVVHLSALAEAARLDSARFNDVQKFIAATDAYWLASGEERGGYNAFAGSTTPDRYYDDNAWMALALLDAYEATRDQALLTRARRALIFALSGSDDRADGGIYWRELSRTGKYACSTAPTILACLRMDAITGRFEFRAPAAVLYRWINKNLQDKDGLFFDHVTLGGQVEKTKISYDSATMIQVNCHWLDSTGNKWFLEEAQRIARSAGAYWLDGATGGVHDDGAQAHRLVDALLDLHARDPDPRWLGSAQRTSSFLAVRHADPNGWHPSKWDVIPREPMNLVRLIDQSCCARTILRTARASQQ
jgi:hypothetical protein